MPYLNDKIVAEFRKIHDPEFSCVGDLNDADKNVGQVTIRKDRYVVRLQIYISDGIIMDAKFKAFSCTVVMSTINYLCRKIKGMKLVDALGIKNEEIIQEFNLGRKKEKENVLCEQCIVGAINNYVSKRNI